MSDKDLQRFRHYVKLVKSSARAKDPAKKPPSCANKPWIVISGDKKPIEAVKSRFMKLNSSHIEYVLKCLSDNTTRIRNVNQYLLATLYNASTTISPYYRSWVNNDMANGLV